MKQFIGRASLDSLKRQSKALLTSLQASDPAALRRLTDSGHAPRGEIALHDAQIVVAREYGYPTWARLKHHLELLALPTYELEERISKAAWAGDRPVFEVALKLLLGQKQPWLQAIEGEIAIEVDSERINEPVGPMSRSLIVYAVNSKVSTRSARLELVRMLLAAGANPNELHMDENWPDNPLPLLYYAAGRDNDFELAKLLLDAGANPNDGESVYHSCEHRDLRCLKLLLERGGAVGDMVINHMLDSDDSVGLRLLLDHLTEPLTPEALTWAVTNECQLALLQMLLEAGAPIDGIRERDGVSAYRLAVRLGLQQHADFLAAQGADTSLDEVEQILAHIARGRTEAGRAAIERIPDFWERLSPADLGLIETLAWHRNFDGVKSMIDLGFPIDSRSRLGDTALHAAGYVGHPSLVRLLVEAGADFEARDGYHNGTPLGWVDHACMNRYRKDADYAECARILLEAGAIPPSSFGAQEIKAVAEHFQ